MLFNGHLGALMVALPLATALNAVHIMRLYGMLFLGVLPKDVPNVPDVLVRERWALSAFVVFLVACGIVPRLLLATAVLGYVGGASAALVWNCLGAVCMRGRSGVMGRA